MKKHEQDLVENAEALAWHEESVVTELRRVPTEGGNLLGGFSRCLHAVRSPLRCQKTDDGLTYRPQGWRYLWSFGHNHEQNHQASQNPAITPTETQSRTTNTMTEPPRIQKQSGNANQIRQQNHQNHEQKRLRHGSRLTKDNCCFKNRGVYDILKRTSMTPLPAMISFPSTDFLRRIIASVEGQGGGHLVVRVSSLSLFPA